MSTLAKTTTSRRLQPFSYDYFAEMLDESAAQGYRISSFERYDESYPRTIILRHDVDFTLHGTLELARIEAERGCSATWLFRVHADEYNLFSCTAQTLVRQIRELGHEIGLHFEAMNVGRALNLDPPQLLRREKAAIEAILGHAIRTASEHRELSGQLHGTPRYHELYDPYEIGLDFYAMDPRYCRQMKYLSDSNAHWREGDLLQHLGRHERFQVLIHADWWFQTDLLLKGPYCHPKTTDE